MTNFDLQIFSGNRSALIRNTIADSQNWMNHQVRRVTRLHILMRLLPARTLSHMKQNFPMNSMRYRRRRRCMRYGKTGVTITQVPMRSIRLCV